MKKGLLTKLVILMLVMGLLVSTASAARLVVYVYDKTTNKPIGSASVSASAGSVMKWGNTNSQGTYTFDIPKDRGTVRVTTCKGTNRCGNWSGKFTTYVRIGI
jgi:hypothetical protein